MSESLPHLYSGKVRDIYDAGDDRLLMVTSDRLSAFDVVMAEPIPDKGRVLTAMSAFWFGHFGGLVGSHLISTRLTDCPPAAQRPGHAPREGLARTPEVGPAPTPRVRPTRTRRDRTGQRPGASPSRRAMPVIISARSRSALVRGWAAVCGVMVTLANPSSGSSALPGSS